MDTLIAQIESDPNGIAPYLVYADALQEAAEPLGQVIMMQHLLAQEPGNDGVAAAFDSLLRKHRQALMGNLELAKASVYPEWHMGFWRRLRVVHSNEDLSVLLPNLLACPLARFVQEVIVFTHRARPEIDTLPPLLSDITYPEQYTSLEVARKTPSEVRWIEVEEEDTAHLGDFPNLEFVSLDSCGELFPPALCEQQELRGLYISSQVSLTALPIELLTLPTLLTIESSHWGIPSLPREFHLGRINNMLQGWALSKPPRRRRTIEANMALGRDEVACAMAETDDLLAALDSNLTIIRQSALRCLSGRWPAGLAGKNRPTANDEIAVIGTLNLKVGELRAKLAERSIKMTRKVSKKTTHVVLGHKPKGKQNELPDLPVCVEPSLVEFLSADSAGVSPLGGPHLTNASSSSLDITELRTWLQGGEEDVVMAIGAMQQAEVPNDLLMEVLLASHDPSLDKGVRKDAKRLFAAYAPPAIAVAAKSHLGNSLFIADEAKIAKRIGEFCVATGIDAIHLAKLLVERSRSEWEKQPYYGKLYGTGLLASADKSEHRLWILRKLLDSEGCINLRQSGLAQLPDEISEFDTLTSLDISHNRLPRLSDVAMSAPALRTVSAPGNLLSDLPKGIGRLTDLRYLNLGENRFQSFPLALLGCHLLEELNLSYQKNKKKILLPDGIGQFTALRRLHTTRANAMGLPFLQLTQLEELCLQAAELPTKIPNELSKLSTLKQLCVTETAWQDQSDQLRSLLPQCEIVDYLHW